MLSAPLGEMALRTSTTALIDAERDRIVFRDAMAGVLPEQVVTRQEKGDYTGMYQLRLRRNFQAAKELIVDGYAASAELSTPRQRSTIFMPRCSVTAGRCGRCSSSSP